MLEAMSYGTYKVEEGPKIEGKIPTLVIDGVNEVDILAPAPSFLTEKLACKFEDDVDPQILVNVLQKAGIPAWSHDLGDTKTHIWVTLGSGEGARTKLKEFINSPDCSYRLKTTASGNPYEIALKSGTKDSPGVPFRDISLLNQEMLSRLIYATAEWLVATNYIKKIAEAMANEGIIPAYSSAQYARKNGAREYAYELISAWVIKYQEAGSSFRFYMGQRVNNLPSDTARTVNGRSELDNRAKYKNAIDKYSAVHGAEPSQAEIAKMLGVTPRELSKMRMAFTMSERVREATPIFLGREGEEADIPASYVYEPRSLENSTSQALSKAIIDAASGNNSPETLDPMGFLTAYRVLVCGDSSKTVAESLNTTEKKVARARTKMKKILQGNMELKEALTS